MTLQLSTAVRNAMLDAIEVAIAASAILRIRTGAPPANVAAASTGTVLATLNLPANWMQDAAAGVKALLGTWQDTAADASGVAAHFEVVANDGTTRHMQGLTSQAWTASTVYTVGQQRANGGNIYQVTAASSASAASGGPTGTGTGITDGGVTWSYVGPADMTLDNTSIVSGQTVTVTSFSLTAPNA
ncbi:MAG: hypothetical protein E6Q40_04545 [Cupriavidus sp.]|nr:MAG: hypothetical protein E6Q40_04545 [Cupriavidus sp.]